MILISFGFFLFLFALVGGLSFLQRKKTPEDYLIADRSIPPWLAGLSAVATNNSGYMFIGMIGYTYATGLSSAWLMIGWILGDLTASFFALHRIRSLSEASDSRSLGRLLAGWSGPRQLHLQRLIGLLTVIFLSGYAAAQFKAGGKALETLLDLRIEIGMVIGAALVLFYSFSGGIRASIWTDAAQSFVMLGGMFALFVVGWSRLSEGGSPMESWEAIPGFLNWFPEGGGFHNFLFVLGWFFGGVAVLGQPQILSRFFALDDPKNLNRMRVYYYSWFTVFYGLTIGVGMIARALIPPQQGFDPESALLVLSVELLPEWGVGLLLAAVFAATMSTADSLVLACTASITEQSGKMRRSILHAKTITALIVLLSLGLAFIDNQSVFRLVLMAWGLLASSFVPLILMMALGRAMRQPAAIATLLSGVAAFFLWRFLGWGGVLYEVAPGIVVGTALAWILSKPVGDEKSVATEI